MNEKKDVLTEEERARIIAKKQLVLEIEEEFRNKKRREEIESIVKGAASSYSNTIVGLENLLAKETIECGINHDEILMFLKEGLNHYIDYNVEKTLLNPGASDIYDRWLKHESSDYNDGFKILDSILDDINPYIEKGVKLIEKIKDSRVLEKLSSDQSYEAIIKAYEFSFGAITEMLNKVILDPFRRSATYEKGLIELRLENLAKFQNVWNEYNKKFNKSEEKPDKPPGYA